MVLKIMLIISSILFVAAETTWALANEKLVIINKALNISRTISKTINLDNNVQKLLSDILFAILKWFLSYTRADGYQNTIYCLKKV